MRLIFVSDRPGGLGMGDFYVSHRRNPHDDMGWGPPELIPSLNSAADEYGPWGFVNRRTGELTLYFNSNRPGSAGLYDIYTSTQQADGAFSTPARVAELSSADNELWPVVRADGLEMFFSSTRPGGMGGLDIWVSSRGSLDDRWSAPVNAGPAINSSSGDQRSSITGDGLEMVFFSPRAGGLGAADMYETRRRRGSLIPVAGSVTGVGGTVFRTSARLSNPTDATISGTIVFRPAGSAPSSSNPSMTYTLAPFETVAHADLIAALGASGIGTLEILPTTGSPPAVLATIQNGGSMQIAAATDRNVLGAGSRAVLSIPDLTRFRYNVGVRTLAAGATISFQVRGQSGNSIRTATHTYPPNTFVQPPAAQLLGGDIAGGQSLVIIVESGSAVVYGASVPHTGTGSMIQVAERIGEP